MKSKLFYLLILTGVMAAITPRVESAGVLVKQWTPYTLLQTARCMIAEADERKDDHVAVAYAAFNLWQFRKQRFPRMRYVDLINAYCSVHKLSPKKLNKRQRWIRELDFPTLTDGNRVVVTKPKDFPAKASWKRKQRIWLETLRLAEQWNRGQLEDPCNGQAVHWGAPMDPENKWYMPSDTPSEKLVRLKCSDRLQNDYYRFKTKWEVRRETLTAEQAEVPGA